MNKNINSTKKDLIVVVLAFIVSLGLLFLLLTETYKEKDVISEYKIEISEKVNDNQQLRGVKDLLRSTEEERKMLDSYFIGLNETVSFIEYIESLGIIAGVLVSIDSVKEDELEHFEEVNMNVSVEGGGEEVFSFLTLLENIPYYIDIYKTRIEKVKDKKTSNVYWTGSFEFFVPKIKQNEKN